MVAKAVSTTARVASVGGPFVVASSSWVPANIRISSLEALPKANEPPSSSCSGERLSERVSAALFSGPRRSSRARWPSGVCAVSTAFVAKVASRARSEGEASGPLMARAA